MYQMLGIFGVICGTETIGRWLLAVLGKQIGHRTAGGSFLWPDIVFDIDHHRE